MDRNELIKSLNWYLGSYRAEWLQDHIFELFAEPEYFTALQDLRPCIIQGGRGTGKTTALKGLSYIGQFELHKKGIDEYNQIPFVGLYHRVDTNHVRAFSGDDFSIKDWTKLFGHYFNLVFCREILNFMSWRKEHLFITEELTELDCVDIAKSLAINATGLSQEDLLHCVNESLIHLQNYVNSINENRNIDLSMVGVPIKILADKVISLPTMKGKTFFLLLDEYENYEEYQQIIVNTLIKHSYPSFTFKIGVRELGWKVKHTHNLNELLNDPADYALIDIEEIMSNNTHFPNFAMSVCQNRIDRLFKAECNSFNISEILQSLTHEQESIELGIRESQYYKEFNRLPESIKMRLSSTHELFRYFLVYWAHIHSIEVDDVVEDYFSNNLLWQQRYRNYSYSVLFTIKKGKAGIRKYYSGWRTLIFLAKGNIRFLMELVYKILEKQIREHGDLATSISYKIQTEAAIEIGKKNLRELERLHEQGTKVVKLLNALGRLFSTLAAKEAPKAPEVNQFVINGRVNNELRELLTASIMNLAITRETENKLNKISEVSDDLYSIHPIYSPYYVISYRRKRKIKIDADDLCNMIDKPEKVMGKMHLDKSDNSEQDSNPDQLSIF